MRAGVVRIGGVALFAAGAFVAGRAEATSRIVALSPENAEAAAVGPLTAYLEGQNGRAPSGSNCRAARLRMANLR